MRMVNDMLNVECPRIEHYLRMRLGVMSEIVEAHAQHGRVGTIHRPAHAAAAIG